jgi:hypothetical protein
MNLRALRLPVLAGLLIGSCAIYDASLLEPDGPSGSGGEAGAGSGSGGSAGESAGGGGGEKPDAGSDAGGNGSDIGTCTVADAPAEDLELFDDFEDGNAQVYRVDTDRSGYWYSSSDCDPPPFAPEDTDDCTGDQTMIPDPPGAPVEPVTTENMATSCGAFTGHVAGSGFGNWGVTIGANFRDAGAYDASAYCGMQFRARVGEGANVSAAFVISDSVEVDGGTMGANFQKGITFTTSWQTYVVLFSEMMPQGTSRPSINTEALGVLNFLIGPLQPFDLWIDDMYMIKKPESGDCPE